jgi:indolepyruvate ferredoxin oxidoreductase, beta subunit
MPDGSFRILVVGVGGQGVLVATKVLGNAARNAGLVVHVGQIHGMSQRGGSVESTVVIGNDRTSFVGPAGADVVLGFEPLETLRALRRMSPDTRVAMSTRAVPLPAMSGQGEAYPDVDDIVSRIRSVAREVIALDAAALASRAGEARCLNVVMLGVTQGLALLPLEDRALASAVDQQSPPQFLDSNRRAFELGREFGEQLGPPHGEGRCVLRSPEQSPEQSPERCQGR